MKPIDYITYAFGILIPLTLILWSYLEKGFYDNYINGELYLIFVVYFLPWCIIAANIIHYVTRNRI
jgi:hypothetical protein